MLKGRAESQLWRRHQNLFLWANQDNITPTRFFYSGFISELKRFFWHIVNTLKLNSFGVLQFSIGCSLQITWTVECFEATSTLEKLCKISLTCDLLIATICSSDPGYVILSRQNTLLLVANYIIHQGKPIPCHKCA